MRKTSKQAIKSKITVVRRPTGSPSSVTFCSAPSPIVKTVSGVGAATSDSVSENPSVSVPWRVTLNEFDNEKKDDRLKADVGARLSVCENSFE
jgi:hypothetical protein